MKLLLIEDNEAMRTTLQRSFERLGMLVVVCGDGARAIDRWQASLPDVVLLDLSLPGLDGLQVLAAARPARDRLGLLHRPDHIVRHEPAQLMQLDMLVFGFEQMMP